MTPSSSPKARRGLRANSISSRRPGDHQPGDHGVAEPERLVQEEERREQREDCEGDRRRPSGVAEREHGAADGDHEAEDHDREPDREQRVQVQAHPAERHPDEARADALGERDQPLVGVLALQVTAPQRGHLGAVALQHADQIAA